MMIVCISSHGGPHGRIISSDCLELDLEQDILRFSVQQIKSMEPSIPSRRFNNLFCPALKGKPKFFLVQACRGDDVDFGLTPNISRKLKIEDTDALGLRDHTNLANRSRSFTISEMQRSTKVRREGKLYLTCNCCPGTDLGGHGHRLLHHPWLRVQQRQGEGDMVYPKSLQST